MKIKPKIYAELLLESIKEKADKKKVAANLWHMLQKNKQYRDLPKILDILEIESAKAEGKILAKVYSEKILTADEEKEIIGQLKHKFNKDIVIKNILKTSTTGVIIKVEDMIIDLSLENKISRLKKKINIK